MVDADWPDARHAAPPFNQLLFSSESIFEFVPQGDQITERKKLTLVIMILPHEEVEFRGR